jgi:hypothetical protein
MSDALSSEPKRLVIFTENDKEKLEGFKAQIEAVKHEAGYLDTQNLKARRDRIESLRRENYRFNATAERCRNALLLPNAQQDEEHSADLKNQLTQLEVSIKTLDVEIESIEREVAATHECQKRINDIEMEAAPYEMLEEIQRQSLDKGDFGVMLRVAQVLQGRVPEITKELATPFLKSIIGSLAQVLNGLDEELNQMASFRAKGFGRQFRLLKTEGFNEDQAMAIILASIKPTTFVEQLSGIKSTAKK